MITTINNLELATKLANTRVKQFQQAALNGETEELPFPDGIIKEMANGDIIYTEEAQEKFNTFYDEYLSIIEETKLQEKKKTFYVFGEEIVQRIEAGINNEEIVHFCKSNSDFSVFRFIDGETSSSELLKVAKGWGDYAIIDKNLFDSLCKL